MSASFSTTVMAGVRLSSLLVRRKVQKEVTKYNPDTGAPYKKTETGTEWVLCGRVIPPPQEPCPDEFARQFFPGLRVVSTGNNAYDDEYDYDLFVVGLAVCEGEEADIVGFTVEDTVALKNEATRLLKDIGYDGPAELHLVFHVGY